LFAYLKSRGITCIVATHDSTDSLSFAEETIVLQDGEVIAKGNSLALYKNPQNKYIASLFGEVNELKLSQFSEIEGEDETLLLYPHQLKIIADGALKAVVKQSYFKGSHYLIKAVANRMVIFFDHNLELEVNVEVCLGL
jgi:ABC-type Fe3+/spermidine/putrescine transport system ATPase subunit